MKKERTMQENRKTVRCIVGAALWGACIFVVTFFVQIPLGSGGYLNLGDGLVLLGAWLLGPIESACAAAVGCCLADLAGGYAFYMPATLVCKAGMALLFYYLFGRKKKGPGRCALASVAAEAWMITSYFFYEFFLLSAGAAAAGLYGNSIQGVFGVILTVSLWSVFKNNTFLSHWEKENRMGEK